ncbi:MAG: glutathione S-transferase family protein [Pseudolabrys sp.]
MSRLTLVSHALCPYVQRAAISLVEKGVAFDRVTVDLANTPDWFRAISPLGKVPLLKVETDSGESVIFESAVILEYLEETQDHPLHPADPLARARHRSWIEFGSAMLNAIARLYGAGDDATLRKEATAIGDMADRLEHELAAHGGLWFDGDRFSLVDAVFAPVFRYFDAFEQDADLRLIDGRPKLAAWRLRLAQRPSVQNAVAPDHPERLRRFLRERRSAISAKLAA